MTAPGEHDAAHLDAGRVRAAFDRASSTYEQAAVLQARVREELLERVELFKLEPRVVLDLGAGTGEAAAALKKRYRRALVLALDSAPGMLRQARRHSGLFRRFERVCAEAARLPLTAASVDLVFSSLMLQWCNDLGQALAEVRRVLAPAGVFIFSTFGPDTLQELRSAWAAVDEDSHVNRFLDLRDVGDALMRAGLKEPVLDVERVRLSYSDSLTLMRDLQAIGASNATAGRPRGLTGRGRFERMRTAYETQRTQGRLPATYEVVYGTAWGSAQSAAPVAAGEVLIPASALRRRR